MSPLLSTHFETRLKYKEFCIMKKNIINKCVAIAVVAALSISFATAYSDVTENAWYYTAIEEATSSGFMHGYPDGTFRPNQAVIRAECAKILGMLDEHPEECGFVDNKDLNAWYHSDVMMHGALMGGIYRDESVPVTGQFMTMYFYPQEHCHQLKAGQIF